MIALHSLKLTFSHLKNGWLEYDRFLLGWPISGAKMLVSERVQVDEKTELSWRLP